MFRNKKNSRAAAHMANAAPSSSAASTAAVQAFLASQSSSSKLSSAAAAAALRSHTASPTNPASIQTKRMQRRLSVSSNGSAASQPTLQRRGSGGSMTERTFRDPSPSRAISPLADRPPIPPIPRNLPKNRPPPSNGRPMSAEPPSKGRPPMSKPPHTRVASLDRGNVKPKNEAIPPMPMPKPKPAKIDTDVKESVAKRPLINFSRPMSPTVSPPASPAIVANGNGNIKKPEPKAIPNGSANNNKKPAQNATTKPAEKSESTDKANKGAHVAAGRAAASASKAIAEAVAAKDEESQSDNNKSASTSKTPISQQSTPAKKEGSSASTPVSLAEKSTKQPSAVKEDVKGETTTAQRTEKSTSSTEDVAPAASSTVPNGRAVVSPDAKPTASQGLKTPDAADPARRRSSLSPGRIARFSAQPVSDMSSGGKHEPLRAASPAKSALKQSPTPRGPSPALIGADVSDNMSVASDEGTKKRRSMRVSFENGPTIVGSAAESSPSRSPFIFSPQDKDSVSRPHFDFGKKLDDYEADEVITPIPTLPSFGSIRGRSDRHSEDNSVLYGDEQARKNLAEMTSSNDHAIGAIVNQHASSQRSNEPLPPQVTSKEGSGYHSDVDSSDEDEKPSAAADELVPIIAVVPATPGLDAETSNTWLPGGTQSTKANGASVETTEGKDNSSTSQPQRQRSNSAPERDSIVEPEPESAQREHDPHTPTIGAIAESLQRQENEDDESDSGDSVYSDAAEDPAELEGDGFGSINAIVDSPVVSPIVSTFSISNKGLARIQDESPSPAERHPLAADWEPIKAYLSNINEDKKTEDEPEAVGIAVTSSAPEPPALDSIPTEKPTIPDKSSARTLTPVSEPKVVPEAKTIPNEPKTKPAPKLALKSSMRQTSPPAVPKDNTLIMRKSMRGPRPTSTMSDSGSIGRPALTARQRTDSDVSQTAPVRAKAPVSTAALTTANVRKLPAKSTQPLSVNGTANGNAKRMSTMSTKSAPPTQTLRAPPPKLSRTLSNDSDSSSSFKRERARKPKSENRYSMRQSMRAAPAQNQARRLPSPDSGPSLRNRPVSMSGVSLRTSMRDAPAVPARPSSVRVSSPNGSFFGRKKNSIGKPPMLRNFSDSSGGEVPTTFRSRFANSSDEEEDEPHKFTPVRGIPRRIIEEDSTDLDDSDEESRPKPKPASTSTPAVKAPGLAAKSMRPTSPETPAVTNLSSYINTDKKRKSIFGVLGRKKDKSKIGKSDLDSAARRDTPLERTKFERKETDRTATPEPPTPLDTPLESPAGSPSPAVRPGKLQRRGMSSRTTSESFFPPPPIPADVPAVQRPITSDGSPQRPPLGSRNVSSTTSNTDGGAIGRTGKKKRFPMLRKAFGLHD